MKNKTITVILAVAAALLMTVSCKKEKSESPIFHNHWIMEEDSYVGIFKFNSNNTAFVGELIEQSYIDQMKSQIQNDPDCYRDSQKEVINKLKAYDWAGVKSECSITENSNISGILVLDPGSNDEETFKYSIADEKLTLTSQLGDGRDLSIVLTSASATGIKLGKMYPAEDLSKPNYLQEHLWLSESLANGASDYAYFRILSSGTIQKGQVVSEHIVNSLNGSIDKYSDTAKDIIRSLAVYDLLYETNYEAAIYQGMSGDGEYNTSGLISIPTLDITNEKYKVNDKSLKIFKGETIAYEFESAASLGIEPGEEYLMSAIQPISE